ncbi:MAG: hypothetical protein AAGA48_05070 [Myxococcota bacterium]
MILALIGAWLGVATAQPAPEQVTMGLEEFLKLYEATKDRTPDPKPPQDFALAQARYNGRVVLDDGEPTSAVFRGRFRVQNLRTDGGWIRVPLLPGTVAVREATIGGQTAPVVLDGGQYRLVTDRRGAFDVDIDFAAAVTTSGGNTGFSFPLMSAGAAELVLSVPSSEDLDFTVANAKLKSDRKLGGNRIVEASLPSVGTLQVMWKREVEETAKLDPRVYAEVHTLVGVGDGLLTTRTTIEHTILFTGVDRFRTAIPDGMTVLDVRGAGLQDWSVDESGTLTASLNFAAEGQYALTIELERLLEDGSVTAPLIAPLGVERSKGFVGVQPLSNVEIRPGAIDGAVPVDVRTLPGNIVGVTTQPVLLGFKYFGTEAVLPLEVREHREVDVLVTLVDQVNAQTMFTSDGRRLSSVKYQVRNNRRQFLRARLPEGAELWSASVAGRAVQPALSGEGELLVPLVRSAAAQGSLAAFGIELVYVENGQAPNRKGKGRFEADLPLVDAPTTYVAWTVYLPEGAKQKGKPDGSLRHVKTLSRPVPNAKLQAGAQREQNAATRAQSGALSQGAAPVRVTLPIDGQPVRFEKLLVIDERLSVAFGYKGLD